MYKSIYPIFKRLKFNENDCKPLLANEMFLLGKWTVNLFPLKTAYISAGAKVTALTMTHHFLFLLDAMMVSVAMLSVLAIAVVVGEVWRLAYASVFLSH